jgi:hypothetical protein
MATENNLNLQGLYWTWFKPFPVVFYSTIPLNGKKFKIITIGSKIVYSSKPMNPEEREIFKYYFNIGFLNIIYKKK